ncbi:unnamed protein product [Blepharisma stoltei]|uniref:Uncharacterized protein n=1 Tax=Blepharisma stoltei TaxID=1481888 RepID=A0AAU9JVB9_9CILI|nr:unnamed protein product [Blepharisma stoltei]
MINSPTSQKGVTMDFIKEISEKVSRLRNLSNSKSIAALEVQIKELSDSKTSMSGFTSREISYLNEKTDSCIEVPPPNDLEAMSGSGIPNDSLNITISSSDAFSDKEYDPIGDHEKIKKRHKDLCKAVKGQLSNLKKKSEENINNTKKFNSEIGFYKDQLTDMKKSVTDLLEEAEHTKEYLSSLRGHFESVTENLRDKEELNKEVEFDISDIKSSPPPDQANILDMIRQLQAKTNLMKQNIYCKETELVYREEENKELKELIARLGKSLVDTEPKLEVEEQSSSCQCIII